MNWFQFYLMGVLITFLFITYILPHSSVENQTKLEYSIIMLIISLFSWFAILFLFIAALIKVRK